jgi:DNA-binding beta-propeller fold protein YncE
MSDEVRLLGIEPQHAIPGGEITIECDGFRFDPASADGCYVEGMQCRTVAASTTRVICIVPSDLAGGSAPVHLESIGAVTNELALNVGERLAENMHMVANPAVDPIDGSLILTRSGSRGQHLPATLFRLETDGYIDEFSDPVLNPTGLAFDDDGNLFVSNRARGEVYLIDRNGRVDVYASGLGIATGLAFDGEGTLYVGDRSGTIYRVPRFEQPEPFASLEPSVAAYHLAFGPDGLLYVTAPGLASHDSVHVIDADGQSRSFVKGFGRPQGLAFDANGDLYVAACYRGFHGIVRISADGTSAQPFIAGPNVVGLCFDRDGHIIVATNSDVYSLSCGLRGTLL